jgi:hypothetical protein
MLTVVVVTFALISLLRLNNLNKSIITVDIPVQEASEKMLEAILAQDNYEKRYLILQGNTGDLFWKRGKEFQRWLAVLDGLPDHKGLPLKNIKSLHRQYGDLFIKEMDLLKRGNAAKASALSSGQLKTNGQSYTKRSKQCRSEQKRPRQTKWNESVRSVISLLSPRHCSVFLASSLAGCPA